jgi:hypothetical protein
VQDGVLLIVILLISVFPWPSKMGEMSKEVIASDAFARRFSLAAHAREEARGC